MNKNDKDVLGCFGILAILLVAIVFDALISGWALSVMWLWFVVPLFGLPHLSVAQAIGLGLIVALFRNANATNASNPDGTRKSWGEIISGVLAVLLSPLYILLFGLIVKSFL